MTTLPALAGARRARARIDATLAWGIDLHTGESGRPHHSIADADLLDPFTDRPDLNAIVAVEPHGPDLVP